MKIDDVWSPGAVRRLVAFGVYGHTGGLKGGRSLPLLSRISNVMSSLRREEFGLFGAGFLSPAFR